MEVLKFGEHLTGVMKGIRKVAAVSRIGAAWILGTRKQKYGEGEPQTARERRTAFGDRREKITDMYDREIYSFKRRITVPGKKKSAKSRTREEGSPYVDFDAPSRGGREM